MIKIFNKSTAQGDIPCVSLTDLLSTIDVSLNDKHRWMKNNIIKKNKRFFRNLDYWKEFVGEGIAKQKLYDYHLTVPTAIEAIGDINSAKAENVSRLLFQAWKDHNIKGKVEETLNELDNTPDIQPEVVVVHKVNFPVLLLSIVVLTVAFLSLLAQATEIIQF